MARIAKISRSPHSLFRDKSSSDELSFVMSLFHNQQNETPYRTLKVSSPANSPFKDVTCHEIVTSLRRSSCEVAVTTVGDFAKERHGNVSSKTSQLNR